MFDSFFLEPLVVQYGLLCVLIGSLLFGETVILTAAVLAFTGMIPVVSTFTLCFIGTIVSDTLWFLIGTRFFQFIEKKGDPTHRHLRFIQFLRKRTGDRPFLILLFIKFLYGTRILTITYLAIRGIRLLTFLFYNAFGTLIWLTVLFLLSWLMVSGVVSGQTETHTIEYGIIIGIILVLIYRLLTVWITRKVENT
jgi:membrane protein DedA with SNARE-associated domain